MGSQIFDEVSFTLYQENISSEYNYLSEQVMLRGEHYFLCVVNFLFELLFHWVQFDAMFCFCHSDTLIRL